MGAVGATAAALGADRVAAIALILLVTATGGILLVERAAAGQRAAEARRVGRGVRDLTERWGSASARDLRSFASEIGAEQRALRERTERAFLELQGAQDKVSGEILGTQGRIAEMAETQVIGTADLLLSVSQMGASLEQMRQQSALDGEVLRSISARDTAVETSIGDVRARLAELREVVETAGAERLHGSIGDVLALLEKLEDQAKRDVDARVEALTVAEKSARETSERLALVKNDLVMIAETVQSVIETGREGLSRADAIRTSISEHERRAKEYVRADRRTATERAFDVEALLQLNALVEPRFSMPSLGGWAIAPRSMLAVMEHVLRAEPRTIVELGSGASTVWLAYAAERYGGRVVSIDHLESFASRTRSMLGDHGLSGTAEVRVAELRQFEVVGEPVQWYDDEALGDVHTIDLLIVDGPPGSTGPQARFPALPILREKMRHGSLVALDDTKRADEAKIVETWMVLFPELRPVHSRSESLSIFRVDAG